MATQKNNWLLPAGIGAGLLLLLTSTNSNAQGTSNPIEQLNDNIDFSKITSSGTRGLRNNNPGNIRKSSDVFQGEIVPSTDPAFKQFIDKAHGYRAIFRIINTYISNGYDTISKIINRWAPAADNNNPTAYINFIVNKTGIGPNTKLTYRNDDGIDNIINIVKQISHVENGVPAIPAEVTDGYNLFKSSTSSLAAANPFKLIPLQSLVKATEKRWCPPCYVATADNKSCVFNDANYYCNLRKTGGLI